MPAPSSLYNPDTPRHSALVRVTHWLTVVAFFALLVSGLEIVVSHPRFYWGETGNSGTTPAEAGFLMQQGDAEVSKLVNGIKASQAWQKGRNAIIVVWDENDYSNAANRVVMLVETSYATNGQKSATFYDHFSLLRTLEAGFGLPCLNHACGSDVKVMSDLFGGSW